MNKNIFTHIKSVLVGILITSAVFAGPGSFSSRSSSSSFSSPSRSSSFSSPSRSSSFSSPSRSYSSPSYSSPSRGFSTPSPSRPSSSPSFGSRPSSPTVTQSVSKPSTGFSWTKSASQAQASKASAEALKVYKQPPVAIPPRTEINRNPVFNRMTTPARNSTQITIKTYNIDRTRYYNGWNRPYWASSFRPYYGGWDTDFLNRMLDTDDMFDTFYHHRHDPGMQAWYRDVQLLAITNPLIAIRLARLNARVQQLEEQKVAMNASYVPRGVPQAAMMAPAVAEQNLPDDNSNAGWIIFWIILISIAAGVIIWLVTRTKPTPSRPNYWL